MSLLEVKDDPSGVKHDPPSGEDYTRGSSHIVIAMIVAFIVVSVGIAAFLWSTHRPPVAAGEATQMWIHAVHALNTPIDASGTAGPSEQFDQVLVLTQVRVRNQSDQAIVVRELLTNVTLEDGPRSSTAAGKNDYDRIFIGYPELAKLKTQTIVPDTIIAPGQTLDGMLVSAFHVSKEQWDTHKDLNVTVGFRYHPDLVLTPKGPPADL